MAASIKTVAEHAGVSQSTVSKVLNDTPGFHVPDDTRLRIRHVVAKLGYVPNRMARSLGKGRSDTIGVIVSGLRNPFFADLVETAESLAADAGYHALIEVTRENSGSNERKGYLSGWPVDGMIVWCNSWLTLRGPNSERDFAGPVVYLGYPRTDQSDWVAFDLYGGGRKIAEHVFETGRKNPWYVTPYRVLIPELSEDRMRAFADVCRERGAQGHIYGAETEEESREAGIRIGLEIAALPANLRPDALVCHNDIIAIGIYHGLRRAGVRVPEDIALTGFDGLSEGQCLDRTLTTVRTSASEMCRVALDILLRRILGEEIGHTGIMVEATLIVGATT